MNETQKKIMNAQAQALLVQLDAFSKVVKFSQDVFFLEREELLEMLQQPYKNVRYVIRKVNQMNK